MIPIDKMEAKVVDAIYNAVWDGGVQDGDSKEFAEQVYPLLVKELTGIPLQQLIHEDIRKFLYAYWEEARPDANNPAYMEMEVEEGVKYFLALIGNRERQVEGKRWGIQGYPDSKVRYELVEDSDGKIWFRWIVYSNSIAYKDVHKKICESVKAIVKTLAERGFPVVWQC